MLSASPRRRSTLPVGHGDVGGDVPESLRRTSSAEGPRDVEERQPREERLERRVDDRETGRSLAIEGAEKDPAVQRPTRRTRLRRSRCGDQIQSDAMPQPGDRRPDLLQLAVNHAVLNIDVLGPVDRGDKRDVLRQQSAYVHRGAQTASGAGFSAISWRYGASVPRVGGRHSRLSSTPSALEPRVRFPDRKGYSSWRQSPSGRAGRSRRPTPLVTPRRLRPRPLAAAQQLGRGRTSSSRLATRRSRRTGLTIRRPSRRPGRTRTSSPRRPAGRRSHHRDHQRLGQETGDDRALTGGLWRRCSPAGPSAATVAIDPGVFRGVLPCRPPCSRGWVRS